jgi:hypothetical protein
MKFAMIQSMRQGAAILGNNDQIRFSHSFPQVWWDQLNTPVSNLPGLAQETGRIRDSLPKTPPGKRLFESGHDRFTFLELILPICKDIVYQIAPTRCPDRPIALA